MLLKTALCTVVHGSLKLQFYGLQPQAQTRFIPLKSISAHYFPKLTKAVLLLFLPSFSSQRE
jgi:hypothetical protein